MDIHLSRWALAGAAIPALASLATPARAADGDPCVALTGEDNAVQTLYIENGDTQEPLVKKLGKLLIHASPKLRLVYRNRPTCNIRNDLFSDAQMLTVQDGNQARTVRYIPESAAFDPAAVAPSCTVPDVGPGEPIALGIGATYLTSCAQTPTQPADVGVFEGPVQAYGFITHKNSNQVAITAEEGYLAYGFTQNGGGAAPWIVQELRFKRGNTASTTLTMSAAVRLLPKDMKAAPDSQTSELLITSVIGASAPDASLGVLGTELFDQRRGDIKLLAFKSFGQRYAYYPDATNESFDKQNVRDGHYLPWSPTPYIAKVTAGTTSITNPHAKRVYDLVMGQSEIDGLLQVVRTGLVPKCAMNVGRMGDGADLALYSDPAPCGCYFEKNVPQGATACTTCTVGNDSPCNGGKCRFGYCEAR
jgi:hypothetical protein